jgi:predicted lipid-binding transport protein (Tim44 family)
MRRSIVRTLRATYEAIAPSIEEKYPLQPLLPEETLESFLDAQAAAGERRVKAFEAAMPAYGVAWRREAFMRRLFGGAFGALLLATLLLLFVPSGFGGLIAAVIGAIALITLVYLTFYERAVTPHPRSQGKTFVMQDAVIESMLDEIRLRYPTL